MEKKDKSLLIFLVILLLILPLAIYLLGKRQELRKRAAGCTIAFNTTFLPQSQWQLLGDRYQVIASGSANKFKLNWSCDVNIASFKVKKGSTDISLKCKSDKIQNPGCTADPGCIPAAVPTAKSGYVICENLDTATYNLSAIFKIQ